MSNKKKSRKKIGKPNSLLYAFVYWLFRIKYKRKHRITFDNSVVKEIKGPAIIVASHTCDMDHILSAMTLYPVRPTYIVSEHFMHNEKTAKLLKLMHVITKKMFTPDVSTIRNILRAKAENAVIVIFPEGRLSCYGHTLPVAEGTAELIKKLGVDLYIWRAEGAYLSFPKWRDKGDSRTGEIHASVKRLLTAEEVIKADVKDIKAITESAILHDDERAMAGVEFKSETMASGVDRILFKCPECGCEGTISSVGNEIRCTCGLKATLDTYYRLDGCRFKSINEWFVWQQNSIDTDTEVISTKVRLGACGPDGFMDENAGEGEAYLDKENFTLKGTIHGEPVDFTVKTERIGAFPITPGEHVDIYHDGKLIYIYPLPDGRMSVKWVCYIDKLNSVAKLASPEDIVSNS